MLTLLHKIRGRANVKKLIRRVSSNLWFSVMAKDVSAISQYIRQLERHYKVLQSQCIRRQAKINLFNQGSIADQVHPGPKRAFDDFVVCDILYNFTFWYLHRLTIIYPISAITLVQSYCGSKFIYN